MNWLDFANALLGQIGAPATPNNQSAILTWMAAEQQPDSPNAPFNPLNIQAHGYPGEAGIVGQAGTGQFAFADFSTGVQQTANFLSQGRYGDVLANLRADAPAASTLGAIQSSGWATSGYGGGLPGLLSGIISDWSRFANGLIEGADPGGGTGVAPTTAQTTSILSNPLSGLASDLVDTFLGPFFTGLEHAGVWLLAVTAAAALMVLGAYQATAPARARAKEAAAPAMEVAGTAAKIGAIA